MKISVIITTILVAQVSASFFDVFQGAVLSVQNSFGKLLSDVVTDVKDTVDCTILAVEYVLSLSHDATTRYYDKCGSENNKTDSLSEARQDARAPKVEVTHNLPNNSEYLQKVIPAETDARINETLLKVFGNNKSHDNVLSIENVFAKESEKLAGVSVIVKKELDKLSHEITTDLKKIDKQMYSEPSVDSILREKKVLEKKEENPKQISEARGIRQVVVQVSGKLHAVESTEAIEHIKIEEILKDLESNSNNSFVGLTHQFEEWKEEESRHLSEIKSKIEEHEKIFDHPRSYTRHGSNNPQPDIFNTDMKSDDVEPIKKSREINTTQVNDTLGNSMSSRIIGDSNYKPLISVANEPSSAQNKTWNENGLNTTAITSTSYSTTIGPFGSKINHPAESSTAVGSSELASFSTNQSTTLQNNLTRNKTVPNETVTNTTLGIIMSAPANETILPVDSLAVLDKQGSAIVTANEQPTGILSTNEHYSNVTVTVSNSLQPPEITAMEDVIRRVKINTDSGKEESSDSATNNDTVIICAAKTAETEMTSTSQSNTYSNGTVVSSRANTMTETAFVNTTNSEHVDSSTSATNESNDTMVTSTPSSINFSTPVNETILPTKSNTSTVEESSTVTAKIVSDNDNDSNNTMLPSTSPNSESTSITETIQPEETTLVSDKDQSKGEVYDTRITNSSLPIVKKTPVSVTIQPEETGTTYVNEKSSTVTKKIVNHNDLNNTMVPINSSPIIVENTSVSGTPEETTTVPGNGQFSNDGTMITSTSLPVIESTLINKTILPDETTTASGKKECLIETTSVIITTLKIVNENDSNITKTSTPTPIISTFESGNIQAIDKRRSSDEESLDSIANSPSGTSNTANADDSSAAMVTMTSETMSESIPQENVTAAENYETLGSTTNSPIASPATLIDTESNTDAITRTTSPTAEITTVSEIIESVESTTPTDNVEPSVLSTTPETIPDKVTNENTDSMDTVQSITENAGSAVVTEIITVEITTTCEEQALSSTSTTTQSAINEIVTTSTALPPTESIPTSESIRAFRNENDILNSPTLEANTSRTPEILNSPDLNFMVRSPPLKITESPPVNREWLTPSKLNQQSYNRNGALRNNYEFNAPISLSDRLPETKHPRINPEVPMYDQASPPITRGVFNNAPMLLTPDRLITKGHQQPKYENDALQKAAFDILSSVRERLSHSDSPFGPEKDIIKIGNRPSTPLITHAPRKPIDPQRINYENPSYVPIPKHPIGPPYSFDDRAPANTYRPQGLTTYRPKKTAAPANNYRSPPMNYDSSFRKPPRDLKAQQRALKEARQLIAKSKRSERIMNNIMKNRNKFNARNVFG